VDTVFHLASVVDVGLTPNPNLQKVNVEGTRKVIEACKAKNVPRLVYTSSMDVVMDGNGHSDATEQQSHYPRRGMVDYITTKVEAEKLVLQANDNKLWTCALRPAHLYGPNDPHAILQVVKRVKSGELKFRMGDGSCKFDLVYIENVAWAHILAARNLYQGSRVCGEAYFICENFHTNFFDWISPYVQAKKLSMPKIYLPIWLLYIVALLSEFSHFLFHFLFNNRFLTLLTKKKFTYEPLFHRYHIHVLCRDATFSHAKATRDFGYRPIVSQQDALKATLTWLSDVNL